MVEWLKNHSKACGPIEIQNTINLNNQLAKTLIVTDINTKHTRSQQDIHKIHSVHNVANKGVPQW